MISFLSFKGRFFRSFLESGGIYLEDLQEFLFRDLYDDDTNSNYELESLLNFIRLNTVVLSVEQIKAMFLLNEFGLGDICTYVNAMRGHMVSRKDYLCFVDSLTLGNRVKGTAKLEQILKSTNSNTDIKVSPSEFRM